MPQFTFPEFPLEIWLEIFSFACTDSGKTSRSLAQTSRYIREVSAEFRHHAVMITGWRQLLAFESQFVGEGGLEGEGSGRNGDGEREVDRSRQDGDGNENEHGNRDGGEDRDRYKDQDGDGRGTREERGKGKGKGVETDYESIALATPGVQGKPEKKNLVHLYVHIPELYTDAYPPESWWEDEESDVDSTYIPSEDEWEDVEGDEEEGDGDGEEQGEGDGDEQENGDGDGDAEPAAQSSEAPEPDARAETPVQDAGPSSTAEPTDIPLPPSSSTSPSSSRSPSPSPSTLLELALNSPTLSSTALSDFASDCAFLLSPTPSIPPITGQTLLPLHFTPLRLAQLEYKILTSLRRLLVSSSSTLRTLTLCFSPSASIYPEAIFPALPKLEYLAVLKCTVPQEDVSPVRYKFSLQRERPAGRLFPSLETLKLGSGASRKRDIQPWEEDAWDGLIGEGVRSVSAPCRIIRCLPTLPHTVTEVFAWGHAKKDETWGRLDAQEVIERFFPRLRISILSGDNNDHSHGHANSSGNGNGNGTGTGTGTGDATAHNSHAHAEGSGSGTGNGGANRGTQNDTGKVRKMWETPVYRETGMSTVEEFEADWLERIEGR